MENSVCAIVVTYNRSELLQKCLKAIKDQTAIVNHILVIDNHSTDETQQILKSMKSDQLKYLRLDKNYGGAGGFKRGIDAAMHQTQDRYFWIMDDDTIPTKTALEELLRAADKQPKFGFLTGNVRWKDGSPMNVPPIAKDWSSAAKDGMIKVQEATFVSLFVERKRVQQVGLPFEDFFIWHDDTEFTTRLYKIAPGYFVTNAMVIHESGSNKAPSIYKDDKGRIPRYFYLYRNEMYICKHHKSRMTTVLTLLRDVFVAVKVLLVAPDNRLKRAMTVLHGSFNGLVFKPKG